MSRPWMPLYVADYLADTGHLTTAEHGAYLLLIMHYWQNGALPADDAKLARIARCSTRDWFAMRATLVEFFGESWSHGRIDRELGSAKAAYERRARAGAKGGLRGSNAKAMLQQCSDENGAMLKQSQSQSQDTPSRKDEAGDGKGRPSARIRQVHPAPAPNPTAWDDDAPFGRDASGGAR